MDRHSLRRGVPAPAKRALSGLLNVADPIRVARARRRRGWDFPIPPRALRAHAGGPDVESFVEGGHVVASELENLIRRGGRDLPSCGAIYDLGCGCGRVLTRLGVDESRCFGSDVDSAAVRWLRGHYPDIDARVNGALPPTSFEDGTFDLVYAISLFTHLPESSQDQWLAEVARLLKPDGIAILTVHGPDLFERFKRGWRPGPSRKQLAAMQGIDLERTGFAFFSHDINLWTRWRFPGVGSSYGVTFHSDAYLRERWSRWLDVADIVPAAINSGQSAVICRRLDAGPRLGGEALE